MELIDIKQRAQLQDIAKEVYAYNLDEGLRKWRAKLAAMQVSTNQIINVQFLGDSITEGAGSDATVRNWVTKGFVGLIRQLLAGKFGDVGTGFIPCFYPTGNSLWTFNGGFVLDTNYGINGNSMVAAASGATASISFVGTGFVLMMIKYTGGGTFNVSIDGGANTQFATSPATFASDFITVASGLADTTHTLTITTNQSSGNVYLVGGYPIKGTKGIRCNMMGKFGITSQAAAVHNDCKPALITLWNPALTVISFTANDPAVQTTLANYQSNIQKLIDWAGLVNSPVLLTTIGMRSENYTIPQSSYFQVIKDLAVANNVALLDISKRWVSYTSANALGFYGDTVHPTAAGHQDIANIFVKTLLES